MLYRVKINRDIRKDGSSKNITEYYLTEAINFGYAGLNIINKVGKDIEVEEVQLMKQYRPAINEYSPGNKVYIIKVAEDYIDDNGNQKTIKYPMPVYANNDNELYIIVKQFLQQGLSNMRLTTISETKWIYI